MLSEFDFIPPLQFHLPWGIDSGLPFGSISQCIQVETPDKHTYCQKCLIM